MHHCYHVAFVDPVNAIDLTERPYRLLVQRPVSREAAERLLVSYSADAAEFIFYNEAGYVTCEWSWAGRVLWDEVINFAWVLAEAEGAMVLNELFGIEYPPDAKALQCASWKRCA